MRPEQPCDRAEALAALCFGLLGCGPKGPLAARTDKVSGNWKGLNEEDPKHPKEGASSNILTESLGGYQLKLNSNGTYSADWRGLKKSGTWSIVGDTIELHTEKVFDKTKSEAGAENKSAGKDVNDLTFYETQNKLELSAGDTKITLKGTQKGEENVIFTRDSG